MLGGPGRLTQADAHRLDPRRRAAPGRDAARNVEDSRGRHRLRWGHAQTRKPEDRSRQSRFPFRCTLECQNFVPPAERELTFSAYGYQSTDVCGIDLQTKKVTNYSDAAGQYDEPEGVFPDGRSTLVECDRECQSGRGPGHVDIWKLSLDGRRTWERPTYFNKYPGYKASNPVVSDDGMFMAFQTARSTDPAGVGYGIFLFDFAKAAQAR